MIAKVFFFNFANGSIIAHALNALANRLLPVECLYFGFPVAAQYDNKNSPMATKINPVTEPNLIPHQNAKAAVTISVEDCQADDATAYLLASPKNAKRLNQAIADVEAGRVVRRGLLEV